MSTIKFKKSGRPIWFVETGCLANMSVYSKNLHSECLTNYFILNFIAMNRRIDVTRY